MANPNRLETLKEISGEITTTLDNISNKHTRITFSGFWSYVGVDLALGILHSNGVDFGLPRGTTRLIATLPFAIPIIRGITGNIREYLPPSKILSLAKSPRDAARMGTAGLSLHSAGEYAQIVATVLGGPEFGASMASTDWHRFLFDPHNIPYWVLNIPGFFLMGKSGVSQVKGLITETINRRHMVTGDVAGDDPQKD